MSRIFEMSIQIFLVVSLFLPSIMARPQHANKDQDAKVIFSEDEREDQIGYKYKFDSSNGISRAETADFEQISVDTGIAVVRGYYSYVGPDNVRYTVTYIADENGFQPKIHKSAANVLPTDIASETAYTIEGIDDDRIGSLLLKSLGGGNIG